MAADHLRWFRQRQFEDDDDGDQWRRPRCRPRRKLSLDEQERAERILKRIGRDRPVPSVGWLKRQVV